MLKVSIGIGGISIFMFYLYTSGYHLNLVPSVTDFLVDCRKSFVKFSEDFIYQQFLSHKTSSSEKLFHIEELNEYNGIKKKELYLSILGNVFDVTRGERFYGVDGPYHFFTGKDASRGFATGELSEDIENDDVADLPPNDIKSISDWLQFYHGNYTYKGKLIGRYYDASGSPTDYNFKIQGLIEKALIDEDAELEEKMKFPPCNVEWSESTGSRVWCSKKSGGIERNWVGVPRKLYSAGETKPRCVCINPDLDENKKTEDQEDLLDGTRDKNLEEYKGCPLKATSCFVIE